MLAFWKIWEFDPQIGICGFGILIGHTVLHLLRLRKRAWTHLWNWKTPWFFPVGLQGNQPILSTYEKNRLHTNWGRGHLFFRSQCSIGSTDFLKISCQEVLKSFTSGVHVLFFCSFFTRITMKNCGSYPPKKKTPGKAALPQEFQPSGMPCSTTKPCCALAGETGRTTGIIRNPQTCRR